MHKLKACPFCGGEVRLEPVINERLMAIEVVHAGGEWCFLERPNRPKFTCRGYDLEEFEAAVATIWNTRR